MDSTTKVTLQVRLDLTESQVRKLAYRARNFHREDPRKGWSAKEHKEGARIAVQQIVEQFFEDNSNLMG